MAPYATPSTRVSSLTSRIGWLIETPLRMWKISSPRPFFVITTDMHCRVLIKERKGELRQLTRKVQVGKEDP